ncbi:MAG: 4-hydroxybenzoate polyprenyltransferase [Candidatus Woesebacteria bacterium GW2011_GWA1_39_21]|uniref:4-hydroxybenzoate polyprenyltransferase n=1 Tax=Candidatus Woesebacteria bacterium GW2011_GWA1_39_21 TaxID=1618550 RepID=A0A0G0NGH7_9BACT|nr:MAG: 4-hydroxybenzoate polyprenyltransferase [Candidatus Woesebacteria bacterium GW2011_GWA1_39_21]
MPKSVYAIINLTRYQDYHITVIITTLLGFLVSGVSLNLHMLPRLSLVLLANLLCVAFAFMINDIEDAKDDARDEMKAKRNPVSAGLISPTIGYLATFAVAALSISIYFYLGPVPFWLGVTSLILSGLYSWRITRLKAIPVIDLVSHGLILAGLQLLCAYFALNPYTGLNYNWIAPFIIVVAVSVRGQLFNQIRDFECDSKAGIRHTTSRLGIKTANYLMTALLLVAGAMFIHSVINKIIPLWCVSVMFVLGVIFLKKPLTKFKAAEGLEKTYNFERPVLLITLFSLTLLTLSRFF